MTAIPAQITERKPFADEFRKELESLLNRHSIDSRCETPDFILADYVIAQLDAFSHTMGNRDKWFNKPPLGAL